MLNLNLVSVEENAWVSGLPDQRHRDLVRLMQEWEEVVEVECST
jgi:hypothetical protein